MLRAKYSSVDDKMNYLKRIKGQNYNDTWRLTVSGPEGWAKLTGMGSEKEVNYKEKIEW